MTIPDRAGFIRANTTVLAPPLVAGKRVIDLAAGSGLVGIAAMKAGAAHVLAGDIDAFACAAASLNAALNAVVLEVTGADLLAAPAPDCHVILVGDLFYEQALAVRVLAWLAEAEARGIPALIGDPGRSYLPREQLTRLGEYRVPVTRDLEDAEIKLTSVCVAAEPVLLRFGSPSRPSPSHACGAGPNPLPMNGEREHKLPRPATAGRGLGPIAPAMGG